MLKQELKARMLAAMKAGREVEKNILRLSLGEIQTAEARLGRVLEEPEATRILRKLLKSNHESLGAATDAAQRALLEGEIAVLKDLLPRTLDAEQVVRALAPIQEAIRAAGNDGQATGLAMKHLQSGGAALDGKIVAQAVRGMRAD